MDPNRLILKWRDFYLVVLYLDNVEPGENIPGYRFFFLGEDVPFSYMQLEEMGIPVKRLVPIGHLI